MKMKTVGVEIEVSERGGGARWLIVEITPGLYKRMKAARAALKRLRAFSVTFSERGAKAFSAKPRESDLDACFDDPVPVAADAGAAHEIRGMTDCEVGEKSVSWSFMGYGPDDEIVGTESVAWRELDELFRKPKRRQR